MGTGSCLCSTTIVCVPPVELLLDADEEELEDEDEWDETTACVNLILSANLLLFVTIDL